jgi:hypothetical protein
MRQLNCQMQDVTGNTGPERSPRLPVHASTSAPGAVIIIGAYQLRKGDPARPGRMPAWLAREVNRAITDGISQPVTQPHSRDYHVV